MAEKVLRTFTTAEWNWIQGYDHKFLVSVRLGLDPEMDGVSLEALVEDYDWLFGTAEDYLNVWGNFEINQKEPNNVLGSNPNRCFGDSNG